MNANEDFERLAAEFYAETGVMAPGKDVPAAMGDYSTRDLREQLWNLWLKYRACCQGVADGSYRRDESPFAEDNVEWHIDT